MSEGTTKKGILHMYHLISALELKCRPAEHKHTIAFMKISCVVFYLFGGELDLLNGDRGGGHVFISKRQFNSVLSALMQP